MFHLLIELLYLHKFKVLSFKDFMVLSNPVIGVNCVMVICPVNTVKNWHEEYDKWLTGVGQIG